MLEKFVITGAYVYIKYIYIKKVVLKKVGLKLYNWKH